MPHTRRKIGKNADTSCPICTSVEGMAWLVRAMQAIVAGEGPPSADEVRGYRRRFEREMRASDEDTAQIRPPEHRPITDVGERRRWLNALWADEVARHAELAVPAHRVPVHVGGM